LFNYEPNEVRKTRSFANFCEKKNNKGERTKLNSDEFRKLTFNLIWKKDAVMGAC